MEINRAGAIPANCVLTHLPATHPGWRWNRAGEAGGLRRWVFSLGFLSLSHEFTGGAGWGQGVSGARIGEVDGGD